MIHDVKKLRAELHLVSFPETEILERGKVDCRKSGPIKPVASGIAYEHASGHGGGWGGTSGVQCPQAARTNIPYPRRGVGAGNQPRRSLPKNAVKSTFLEGVPPAAT